LERPDIFGKRIKLFYSSRAVLPQVGVLGKHAVTALNVTPFFQAHCVFLQAWAFEKVERACPFSPFNKRKKRHVIS
jgi:hypothetical protein